ncbi:hypothetical protein QVD17_02146 [Tagetes erecta]|uniref:PHD-type zinc finger plants domain-containing protein n=1 Tax=Tagetes erecta TaxID=13708 RepID=A0AAD8P8S4_TARER|nr:hypothetical protein QVD17_02146 [Tagetes erecta]
MVATKSGGDLTKPITSECCMCGDYGLSQQLFRCKICKSRFQHEYCSNQYPKAELYKACNWCLTQKHVSGNSSSCKNSSGDDHTLNNKRNHDGIFLQQKKKPSSPAGRKRVDGGDEKNQVVLRKSKSANHISNGGGINGMIKTTKPLVRNKVRRYKLLDEVSTQ